MKYSIIISVYNVEPYLNRCLDSVIDKERDDIEVILVDDGSTDDSGRLCDIYSERYNCITVIHQKNQGLAAARNSALEIAKGEWIIFLDADDYWSDDYFDVIDKAIEKHPADLYKFNYMKVFDSHSPDRNAKIVENELLDISSDENKMLFYCEKLLTYSIGWEVVTGIYKKSIIDSFGMKFYDRDTIYALDLLFSMEYILHARNIYLLCDFLYMYYTREGSLSLTVKSNTVLPRLFNLLDVFENEISNNKHLERYYYKIYFYIINFHVKYNLRDVDIESLRNEIKSLNSKRQYKKFSKLIRRDNTLCSYIKYGRDWL